MMTAKPVRTRRSTTGSMFVRIPGSAAFLRAATASISDVQGSGEVTIGGNVMRRGPRNGHSFSISAIADLNPTPLAVIAGGKMFDAVIAYGEREALVESLEQVDGALALRNCAVGAVSRSNVLDATSAQGVFMTVAMDAVASEVVEVRAGNLQVALSLGAETVVAVDVYGDWIGALSVARNGIEDYRVRLHIYDGAEWRSVVVGDYALLSAATDYKVALCHDGKSAIVVCRRNPIYLSLDLVNLDGRIVSVRTQAADVLALRHGRHLYAGFTDGVVSRLDGKRLVQVANAPSGTYGAMALSASGESFVFCADSTAVTVDLYNRPSSCAIPVAGSEIADIQLGEATGTLIARDGVVYVKDSRAAAWRVATQITGGGSSTVITSAHIAWPLMAVSAEVSIAPAAVAVDVETAPPFFAELACVVMASIDGVHWSEVPRFDRGAAEDGGPIFAVSAAEGRVLSGGLRRWPMGADRLLQFDGAVLCA